VTLPAIGSTICLVDDAATTGRVIGYDLLKVLVIWDGETEVETWDPADLAPWSCSTCDGSGTVEVGPDCSKPPSLCCGGCFRTEPCPECGEDTCDDS